MIITILLLFSYCLIKSISLLQYTPSYHACTPGGQGMYLSKVRRSGFCSKLGNDQENQLF